MLHSHLPHKVRQGIALAAFALLAGSPPAAWAVDCNVGQIPVPGASAAQQLAQQLRQSHPCQIAAQVDAHGLRQIWQTFMSSHRTGGLRFATSAPKGTPVGSVMPIDGFIDFDFSTVASQGLRDFRLVSANRVLLSVNNPATLLRVPATALDPKARYAWTLQTGQGAFEGSFQLLDAEDQHDVQQRLQALRQAGLAPGVELLYRAEVFDDEGLYAQRDATFVQLERQSGVHPTP